MLKIFFLLLPVILVSSHLDKYIHLQVNNDSFSTSHALYDVVDELFVRREIYFEIFICGRVWGSFSDQISDLLTRYGNKRTINRVESWFDVKESAVMFVDTKYYSSNFGFVDILSKFPKNLFFLIIPDCLSCFQIEYFVKNPNSHFGHISQYSYFFIEKKWEIELKTFEWWTEKACNTKQFIELNTFDKRSLSWKKELKLPQKFVNFQNCSIKYTSSVFTMNLLEILLDYGILNMNKHIQILVAKRNVQEKKLQKLFANYANFTIDPKSIDDEGFALHERTEDHTIYEFKVYHRSLDIMTAGNEFVGYCTTPFFEQSIFAMYSPPEPYTNYEKMTMPFDFDTWFYLLIVFFMAFVLITLINFFTRLKEIVYGKGIKMPSFNVVRTAFGIGQTILPENSFARIILVTFIIFCLIFRTAYQGNV